MGLIIGFLGIVVVSVDGLTVHVSIIGVVLGLLMAFSWALGVVYVKKVSNEVDAFWMVSLQCIIGGAILIGTGTIFENWSAIEWNGKYLLDSDMAPLLAFHWHISFTINLLMRERQAKSVHSRFLYRSLQYSLVRCF